MSKYGASKLYLSFERLQSLCKYEVGNFIKLTKKKTQLLSISNVHALNADTWI